MDYKEAVAIVGLFTVAASAIIASASTMDWRLALAGIILLLFVGALMLWGRK